MLSNMENFISIIVVNYNGKKFLEDFLASVKNISFPKNKYEVIVMDNASTDDSVGYIKKYYPDVKVIESKKNLGFGGGNNLAMSFAKGNLYFLVNNDTVLDKYILKSLESCFNLLNKQVKVGAITSKLVLFNNYLYFAVKDADYVDHKLLAAKWEPTMPYVFSIPHEASSYNADKIYIPISHTAKGAISLTFTVGRYRYKSFEVEIAGKIINGVFNNNENAKTLSITIPKSSLEKYRLDLIQNAGNFYFRDGYGRDRGSLIYCQKQYYEPDTGQYDKSEIVPGFCGAGVLLNKEALKDVGNFDNDFFMYYEDGDLSMRLKKSGWEVIYCPKAKVRHIHTGSSREWSPFFVYNVERNRLLLVAKHWPRLLAVKEWLKYILRETILSPLYHFKKNRIKRAKSLFRIRLRVNLSLLFYFPKAMFYKKRYTVDEINKFL